MKNYKTIIITQICGELVRFISSRVRGFVLYTAFFNLYDERDEIAWGSCRENEQAIKSY